MKKNILVVDDSALMRRIICDIINSDEQFQATEICHDGLEAYELLQKKSFDAVILDVNMPRMDGLELLERLRQEQIEATVVMVSSLTVDGASVTLRAMELGAVDFVKKPENLIEAKGSRFHDKLLMILNSVVFSKGKKKEITASQQVLTTAKIKRTPQSSRVLTHGANRLIALACSTGGPKSLQSVLPLLKANLDAPMVLVQHMPAGFTKSLAERLNELSEITVKEAQEGDVLKKGTVYIAPGGKHLEVLADLNGVHRLHLNDGEPVGGLKPCANITFQSLIQSKFDEIVCVVLNGMGVDGTKGITELAEKKPVYVIAQDEESSVVYGMPRAIAEAGMVDEVVPLEQVARAINNKVGVK